jgi:hypothetical protein
MGIAQQPGLAALCGSGVRKIRSTVSRGNRKAKPAIHYLVALPLHYLFGAIPVGGNR